MGQVLQKLLSVFYTRKLDLVLVGLENSGKTTLLNALASGYDVDTVPTVGMNVKSIKKGRVKMKIWDLGGQSQYRSEWSRYIKGCDCMVCCQGPPAAPSTWAPPLRCRLCQHTSSCISLSLSSLSLSLSLSPLVIL
eukprot:TRINITY_DN852_c0_g1_i2.p1 TRINITY_DN852_c0_g1~~TRINITY_DN852_c0_g1_i2.p1  ORF type:complete len:136 (+),score=24.49 TRINITY_DN852_c0_g1_i2:243-650(+)